MWLSHVWWVQCEELGRDQGRCSLLGLNTKWERQKLLKVVDV